MTTEVEIETSYGPVTFELSKLDCGLLHVKSKDPLWGPHEIGATLDCSGPLPKVITTSPADPETLTRFTRMITQYGGYIREAARCLDPA
jgi:hypothetical protein